MVEINNTVNYELKITNYEYSITNLSTEGRLRITNCDLRVSKHKTPI